MSRLESAADYRREIAALDDLLEHEARLAARGEVDFAAEVQAASLRRKRERLVAEMESIGDDRMKSYELDVVFTGTPVEGHTIAAEFLGKVLQRLQLLLRSIVEGPEDRVRQTKQHKRTARRISTLRLAQVFEGSFGMRLEARQEQGELDGLLQVAPGFNGLVDLVGAAGGEGDVLGQLAAIGPKATSEYRKLLEAVAKGGADMHVEWPTIQGPRRAMVRAGHARRTLESITDVRETVIGHWYVGELDGGMRRRGIFEFNLDDGTVIGGSVEPEMTDRLKDFFAERCRAYILTRTVVRESTGERREHHRLQVLEPLSLGPGDEL